MSYSPEERFLAERVKRSVDQVHKAIEQHLSGVQDHVNFNLQKAYFKCAHDCFDRQRNQQEISNCVEYCSVPVVQANNAIEEEMSRFQVLNTMDSNTPKTKQFSLLGYSDSDYAGDSTNGKSTCGFVMHLGSFAISWRSKKQLVLAVSSSETEYMAASEATREILWLQIILEDLQTPQERLRRSLMVCQDRLEATKFINQKEVSHIKEFESCVDQTIKEQIQLLPHVVDRLKLVLSKNGNL